MIKTTKMIKISTKELQDAVGAAYDFDKEHGVCTDGSTEQFTGNCYHETYEFDGKTRIYYFSDNALFGYEDK